MRSLLSILSFSFIATSGAQIPDSLRGDWNCVDVQCKIICEECCIYPRYEIRLTDSLYYFEYPTQFIRASAFHPEYWHLSNDSLIYTPDSVVLYIYKRPKTIFSDVVIEALKRDTINVLSLANRTWNLKTWKEDDIGEDGFDHTIHYPFRLPSRLFYSLDELKNVLRGSQLQLLIDGKKRWCTIVELDTVRLTFRTGKWYKEPVEFTYELAD